MQELANYLEQIHSRYPALHVERAEPDTFGQYNHVLLINDAWIFRFPRYPEGIRVLAREAAFLDAVRQRLPLPVPDFTYRSLDGGLGEVFVGYRRIPGQLLWGETLRSIQDAEIIRRLAEQLAGFLHVLHHIPPQVVNFDLPLNGERAEWEQMYREIAELLFPLMRPDARAAVKMHFETYLDDPALQYFEPCLTHYDFGPGNVLYDVQSRSVCGIIDFGFAGLGDPAQDIAAASCFGDAYLRHYPAAYPGIEALLPRARFIKGTFALSEALHGIKNNDREAFDSGMEQYINRGD